MSNVIHQLSQNTKKYINYRDSKLTRILQQALGGNSRTLIICTISQSKDNYQETLSTLLFGVKAKKIKNIVKVNEGAISEASKLAIALEEIERLKGELNKLSEVDEIGKLKAELKEKTEKVNELRNLLRPKYNFESLNEEHTLILKKIENIKVEIQSMEKRKKKLKKAMKFNESNEDFVVQKDRIQELEETISNQKIEIQNVSTELIILKSRINTQDPYKQYKVEGPQELENQADDNTEKEVARNTELLKDMDKLYTELELDKEAIRSMKELNEKRALDLKMEVLRKEELARESERLIELVYNNYIKLNEVTQKIEVLEKERAYLKVDITYYRREAIKAKKIKEGKLTTNELITELQLLREDVKNLRDENMMLENGLPPSIKKKRRLPPDESIIELKRKKLDIENKENINYWL